MNRNATASYAVQRALLLALLTLSVTACGKDDSEAGAKGADGSPNAKQEEPFTKPVTVTLFSNSAGINTDQDLEVLTAPVRNKYPNLTIEQIKGVKIDQLIAAGEVPDLIATTHRGMMDMLDLGLGSDLNEMIRAKQIDLNRFEPEIVKAIRTYGPQGEMYGLPYAMNYGVLVYNKEIFNKFGVPYPKDGMTWSELLDLAKKVTRDDNGVSYVGWDGGISVYTRGDSLAYVDEKREKALLTTERFGNIFKFLRSLYDIPGIVDKDGKYTYGGVNYFIKDRKLAMYPFWIAGLTSRVQQLETDGNNFDWDLAAFPSYDDKPGIGREVEFQSLMVTSGSKNKEAAYRVIETLVSQEAQAEMNNANSLTVLNDLELRKQFGKNVSVYKNKNIEGIFSVKPAPAAPVTVYDAKIESFLSDAVKSMVQGNNDINTVLREANEKANKYIQEVKAQ